MQLIVLSINFIEQEYKGNSCSSFMNDELSSCIGKEASYITP